MKLQQGQIWKTCPSVHGHQDKPLYLRIVSLERLSVAYKEHKTSRVKEGQHKTSSKKVFCRLIKKATLLNQSVKEIS